MEEKRRKKGLNDEWSYGTKKKKKEICVGDYNDFDVLLFFFDEREE